MRGSLINHHSFPPIFNQFSSQQGASYVIPISRVLDIRRHYDTLQNYFLKSLSIYNCQSQTDSTQ